MPVLLFDPEGLHRAVLNVITNAIDACDGRESGRVTVSTSYSDDASLARVIVGDTGAGIPRDDLEKIFSIFVSKKGGRGTGLGLPVSQKILKEHGGRIRVASEPEQGSCFTLELPAVQPQPAERHTMVQNTK
jgi:signal transduction histidine kinase